MAFQMKALEISEFSGGMTDTYITAGPSKYQYADNFWITTDKNLLERNGTDVIDGTAFQVGNLTERVSSLWTFINDTILLGASARTVYQYVKNSSFAPILGYTGQETLGAGGVQAANIAQEWHRHLYITNDSQPIPSKIYRDHNNVFQARTIGLPRAIPAPNISATMILYKAVSLANDLAVQMQAHIQDMTYHTLLDKVALNYFVAQTFNPGEEQPPVGVVPQATCVDLPTLLSLIGNLNAAYEHQRADASLNGSRVYHTNFLNAQWFNNQGTQYLSPTGMHVRVANSVTPLSLTVAAASVDDLAQKWFWHRLAVWTHDINNDYNFLNQYATTAPKVGTINTGAPVLTPDLTDAFNFVNNIKAMWNYHITDWSDAYLFMPTNGVGFFSQQQAFQHKQPDGQRTGQYSRVNLPDCTGYDDMANLIFHMRILYNYHYGDVINSWFTGVQIGMTNASSAISLTWTNPLNSGLAVSPFADTFGGNPNWLSCNLGPAPANAFVSNFPYVLLSTSTLVTLFPGFTTGINGTATTLHNVTPGATATANMSGWVCGVFTATYPGQLSNSQYHVWRDSTGLYQDAGSGQPTGTALAAPSPASGSQITSQVDSVGIDLHAWNALASELFYCLAAHSQDGQVHSATTSVNQGVGSAAYAGKSNILNYLTPYAPFFVPTIASYSYAFLYTNTYTVEPNGLEYEVQSNPIFVGPVQMPTIIPANATIVSQFINIYPNVTYKTTKAVTVSNLPVLTNDSNHSYDISLPAVVADPTLLDPASNTGTTLDIYRTSDGGVTYYLAKQNAIGTLSWADFTADSAAAPGFPQLNLQLPIYTSGGVVGNDQPPQATCMTLLNGYMYYGNVYSYGQQFPNRVMQSLPNAPDAVPATFYDDLDDAIVGLGNTRSVVLALCSKSIYRLTGQFNSLGQGLITHEKISDAVGCVSARSIVKTEIGIFFAGTDGFYYTDGYQLIKVTIDLNMRYAGLTTTQAQASRISGVYDRYTRRIYWTVQQNPTDTNCDSMWVFYLDYGVKPDGVFTTISSTTNMRPAAVAVFNQILHYGHEFGYVLKFDPMIKTDPVIVTGVNPSLWQETYIPYNFQGSALTFDNLMARKWTTKLHVMGNNVGNAAIQAVSVNDNNYTQAANLPIINYTMNPMWGAPGVIWNKPQAQQPYSWEYDGDVDAWRRFPAGNMRCDLKQIILQPAFVGVYRYEDWPLLCFAATNNGTKAVTISTPTGYTSITWPLDIVGMQFAFSNDGFINTYTVTSVTGNSAVVSDPGNTLATLNNLTWVIRGYKKQQRVSITAMVIHYDYLGDKNSQYLGPASAGENV